ncbi:hypothetical protein NX801_21280 [Streptomyces sp. LP05-1]|uniref:Integral membrane protein n=1 Tax=Streptomyces pyxinae TaxID=2970734 RepID=A0ABT2CL51_9ACTN|nr:hypothetical protein [Streptomyces sp. LP05-1]MCS0638139.1 hypothetical protein [Streptomyces sp. LP05-1]
MNTHRTSRSSSAARGGTSRQVQGGLSAAALILLPLLAIGGSDSFRAALDFTTGVLSLLSLTASVAWGLLAKDRLLLSTRHRLVAQAVHRTTAVASLGFLLLHATVKVSLGHVALLGALVPFGLGVAGTSGLIGLGSLAGLLMVIAAATGAARSALAGRSAIAARWRPLHMLAYPAWCFALMHGLFTGRPAATWVTTLYCLALAAVAGAVSLRLLPPPVQRRLAGRLLALFGPGAGPTAPDREDTAPPPGAPESLAAGAGGFAFEGLRREDATPPGYGPGYDGLGATGSPARDRPLGREQPRAPLSAPPGYAPEPAGYGPEPAGYEPEPVGYGSAAGPAEPAAPPARGGSAGRRSGIFAGYRAMSGRRTGTGDRTEPLPAGAGRPRSASGATGPGPATGPGAGSTEVPFARRVPMTEELPVFTEEPATPPGRWPTPSPPPPARSPAPPSYAPFSSPGGPGPGFGPGFGPGPSVPPSPSPAPSGVPAPGPFQQPPAGEPWTAPAGDRP